MVVFYVDCQFSLLEFLVQWAVISSQLSKNQCGRLITFQNQKSRNSQLILKGERALDRTAILQARFKASHTDNKDNANRT